MVGVESQLGAARALATLHTHLEGLLAADAELELTLGAGEVHAAPAGEGVAELAAGAGDAVLREVGLQTLGLVVRVVGLLPGGEVLAADAGVSLLPLKKLYCNFLFSDGVHFPRTVFYSISENIFIQLN